MARKKNQIPTVQIRVSQDVADLAAIVAAYRRKSSTELLTEILRPILTEMHGEEIKRAGSRPPPAAAPPKKGGK